MFRHKHTILRERNKPGLKPIANDKLLFTWFQSVVGSLVNLLKPSGNFTYH
jgi:hypothetical protein